MEAVAADTGAEDFLWKRKKLRDRRHGAMKRGVEAGDLGNIGPLFHGDFDGREVGGKMQRGESNEFAEIGEDLPSDANRLSEVRAAVDYTVSDGAEFFAGEMGFEPRLEDGERALGVFDFGWVESTIQENTAGCVPNLGVRFGADAVDQAVNVGLEVLRRASAEQRKLEAGGPGIEDENRADRGSGAFFRLGLDFKHARACPFAE